MEHEKWTSWSNLNCHGGCISYKCVLKKKDESLFDWWTSKDEYMTTSTCTWKESCESKQFIKICSVSIPSVDLWIISDCDVMLMTLYDMTQKCFCGIKFPNINQINKVLKKWCLYDLSWNNQLPMTHDMTQKCLFSVQMNCNLMNDQLKGHVMIFDPI